MEELVNYIRQGLPCLFHELTGLYCPGCGGTRAVKALLGLDFSGSFRYHPVVLYTAVAVVAIYVLRLLSEKLKRPRLRIRRYEIFAYIGGFVILINWVVKNYYLIAKGVDLLKF